MLPQSSEFLITNAYTEKSSMSQPTVDLMSEPMLKLIQKLIANGGLLPDS